LLHLWLKDYSLSRVSGKWGEDHTTALPRLLAASEALQNLILQIEEAFFEQIQINFLRRFKFFK